MMAQPGWPNEVPLGARRAGQVARSRATLSRSTSLREAAARLAADRAGMAVVQDAGRPIEVMSLRDLAVAIAAGVDLDESTVGDLRLVRRPYILSSAGLVPTLDKMIGAAASEALVLDEDGLVGVVTLAGICESLVSPTVEICAGVTSDPLSRGLQVQAPAACDLNPDMEIWVGHDDNETTITVRGRLDEATAPSLARVIDDLPPNAGGPIRLDLRRLDRRSCAGLARLHELVIELRQHGRFVRIA